MDMRFEKFISALFFCPKKKVCHTTRKKVEKQLRKRDTNFKPRTLCSSHYSPSISPNASKHLEILINLILVSIPSQENSEIIVPPAASRAAGFLGSWLCEIYCPLLRFNLHCIHKRDRRNCVRIQTIAVRCRGISAKSRVFFFAYSSCCLRSNAGQEALLLSNHAWENLQRISFRGSWCVPERRSRRRNFSLTSNILVLMDGFSRVWPLEKQHGR